jgi:hypothetical protein
MARTITYSKRDFQSLKQDQINYIRQYYPDLISNFNDASIMSVLTDLNAGIADNLHYGIDRNIQETFLDFAQERKSLYFLAKTFGLKLPNKAASIAVCEFTAQVPVFGDSEDKRYLPIIKAGTQVFGNGNSYELLFDIDFSSPYNVSGVIDRTKVPLFNSGVLTGYRIKKSGIVIAGTSKVYTQTFDNSTPIPFYNIILPDNNVLSIESIISKAGTNLSTIPDYADFDNPDYKWYEVDALAESSVFVEDKIKGKDKNGIPSGDWLDIDRRFIKEFLPSGYCKITFGNQTDNGLDILDDYIDGGTFDLRSILNNASLGSAPQRNTTMYIKYRVGGGADTNVGVNVINTFGTKYITLNGPDAAINRIVDSSISVNNVTPAVGGGDELDIEEIRYLIAYNFASQNRMVTLSDYKTTLVKMPKNFGAPARIGVKQNMNKIELSLITYDNEGKFTNQVPSTMMQNVANYLSKYRMLNDYIFISPGEVIDLGFEISVVTDNGAQISTTATIIDLVKNEFSQTKQLTGKPYQLNTLIKKLSSIASVQNINSIKVFNKVGGEYSNNIVNQTLSNSNTRQLDLSNGQINCNEGQVLQIRNPDVDIVVIPTVSNTSII